MWIVFVCLISLARAYDVSDDVYSSRVINSTPKDVEIINFNPNPVSNLQQRRVVGTPPEDVEILQYNPNPIPSVQLRRLDSTTPQDVEIINFNPNPGPNVQLRNVVINTTPKDVEIININQNPVSNVQSRRVVNTTPKDVEIVNFEWNQDSKVQQRRVVNTTPKDVEILQFNPNPVPNVQSRRVVNTTPKDVEIIQFNPNPVSNLQSRRVVSTTPEDVEIIQFNPTPAPRMQLRGAFQNIPPPMDSPFVPKEEDNYRPIREERSKRTTERYAEVLDTEYNKWTPGRQNVRNPETSRLTDTTTTRRSSDDSSSWLYTTERYYSTTKRRYDTSRVQPLIAEDESTRDSSSNTYSNEDTNEGRSRESEKWCKKYNNDCKAGRSDPGGLDDRITGGKPAKPREHPHMAMIGYGQRDKKEWLCGGSLVSVRWVLSAAHCANVFNGGPAKWTRLGDLDVTTRQDDAAPQEREIIERIVHPGYKEPKVYNDIALFKLDRDVELNAWVSPVCLDGGRSQGTHKATVTGWGRTNFVSDTSPILMKVDVTIFNSSYCKKMIDKISDSTKMNRGFDVTTMICAGEKAGGKDACQGDSGGPLVVTTGDCPKLQVGITSIGRECGLPDSPGVYTRVANYIDWLESNIWR